MSWARRTGTRGGVAAVGLLLLLLPVLSSPAQGLPQTSAPASEQGADAAQAAYDPQQTGSTVAAAGASTAPDPPARVARLSQLSGDVSTEPASVDTFAVAELNAVLTTGDRLYTDTGAQAELEAGTLAVRLGGGTDLTVTALTDTLAQLGLASGSVHLRSYSLEAGTVLELDTAEAAVTVLAAGDVRVDSDPGAHATTVSVLAGQVQLDGPGLSRVMNAGDRVRVVGADPNSGQASSPETLGPETPDGLDGFSDGRDSSYASGEAASNAYLNAQVTGGSDLASYGSWDSGDYGPVWYPAVAFGWLPYRTGHWGWVAPWGWTWIGPEPWGFAPFHYGRWVCVDGRWGWIPGPPRIRAVYAPALVGFVGGARAAAGGGGAGLVGWFPLGPREPYAPPFHGSTLYLNRVNASNIYDPNTAQARAFYNQRAVNVFAGTPTAERVYRNRAAGTSAMPVTSFAEGRPVAQHGMRGGAEQLAEEPVTTRLVATPERTAVASETVRALPAQMARPTLAGHPGTGASGFAPGGTAASTAGTDGGAALANRPLFHRMDPPVASVSRPGFEGQRGAVGEGVVLRGEDLRVERPSGAVPAHGTVPHPSSAARPAPPPAKAEPPAVSGEHKR